MPIGYIMPSPVVDTETLVTTLTQEWLSPSLEPEPVLIEEPSGVGNYKRLYVVWSEWNGLSHRQRTEIIMHSYRNAHPEDALDITIAMGLTPKEAADMGIYYTLGKNEENE